MNSAQPSESVRAPPTSGPTATAAPVANVAAAVASSGRSADNVKLDESRKPAAVLNAADFISGRYANLGPRLLAAGNYNDAIPELQKARQSPNVRLNASFSPIMATGGRVALLSQSGALGIAILDLAARREEEDQAVGADDLNLAVDHVDLLNRNGELLAHQHGADRLK